MPLCSCFPSTRNSRCTRMLVSSPKYLGMCLTLPTFQSLPPTHHHNLSNPMEQNRNRPHLQNLRPDHARGRHDQSPRNNCIQPSLQRHIQSATLPGKTLPQKKNTRIPHQHPGKQASKLHRWLRKMRRQETRGRETEGREAREGRKSSDTKEERTIRAGSQEDHGFSKSIEIEWERDKPHEIEERGLKRSKKRRQEQKGREPEPFVFREKKGTESRARRQHR